MDRLYTEAQLNACMAKIETADFLQTLVVDGIKFQFLNAGHVLGAAMIMIEIAGVRVLYTGDYSCEEDRHLMAAKPPTTRPPHVLIVEATYGVKVRVRRVEVHRPWVCDVYTDLCLCPCLCPCPCPCPCVRVCILCCCVCVCTSLSLLCLCWCVVTGAQTHMPRERRERHFTSAVESTVLRNGRCLIPVFALGRAQELLLILGASAACAPCLCALPACLPACLPGSLAVACLVL